jgi:hypothetical protein
MPFPQKITSSKDFLLKVKLHIQLKKIEQKVWLYIRLCDLQQALFQLQVGQRGYG